MSENQYYFLIADEKFLCALDGSLVLLSQVELDTLDLQIVTQHRVSAQFENFYDVVAVDHREINNYQWLNLRAHLGVMAEEQFQLAGRALQILRWHFDHQFCGRCGKPTRQHISDLAKSCNSCGIDFYPRLSPCIITLVIRGEYCLLAWHTRSNQEKYSCLAGFIEVGESPEQTLVREVMEEVNIKVNNIRYVTSQPWPFPGQLMLGYFADYASGEIQVDNQEIRAADWYHYNQLPNVPPIATISGQLIAAFVDERKRVHPHK